MSLNFVRLIVVVAGKFEDSTQLPDMSICSLSLGEIERIGEPRQNRRELDRRGRDGRHRFRTSPARGITAQVLPASCWPVGARVPPVGVRVLAPVGVRALAPVVLRVLAPVVLRQG